MTSEPSSFPVRPANDASADLRESAHLPDGTASPRNAVVLIVDRLSASYLGCYGNTWLETPELNQLATESLLLEFATTHSAGLEEVYGAYWRGAPAASAATPASERVTVPDLLRRQGVHVCLVTDDPSVAESAPPDAFDQRVVIADEADLAPAASIPQMRLAQVFAAALELLESLPQPFLLWVHLRGMAGPWDAPYALRQSLTEEEDPAAPDVVEPPTLALDPAEDHDQRWGLMRAYAGQVLALDACLGIFLEELRTFPGHDSTLFAWTSTRGYPLGEHGEVGCESLALHGETLHVPWGFRFPDGRGAMHRSACLAHSGDLGVTLLDWWGVNSAVPATSGCLGTSLLKLADDPDAALRPYVVLQCGQLVALRTHHWLATREVSGTWRLYVKPDDRFEMNEVSDRCRDVVDALESWFTEYQRAAAAGFTSLPLLPEHLRGSLLES